MWNWTWPFFRDLENVKLNTISWLPRGPMQLLCRDLNVSKTRVQLKFTLCLFESVHIYLCCIWIFVFEILLKIIIMLNKKICILGVNLLYFFFRRDFRWRKTLHTDCGEVVPHLHGCPGATSLWRYIFDLKKPLYIYVAPLYSEKWRGIAFIHFSSKTLIFWFVVNVRTSCGITYARTNV